MTLKTLREGSCSKDSWECLNRGSSTGPSQSEWRLVEELLYGSRSFLSGKSSPLGCGILTGLGRSHVESLQGGPQGDGPTAQHLTATYVMTCIDLWQVKERLFFNITG